MTPPTISEAVPADPKCPDERSSLAAFGRRILGLGHHVHGETGLTHLRGHLRDHVPNGLFVGTNVDAFGLPVTLPDGGRQIVHVDRCIVEPRGAVLGDRNHWHFPDVIVYGPHLGHVHRDTEFHDVRG